MFNFLLFFLYNSLVTRRCYINDETPFQKPGCQGDYVEYSDLSTNPTKFARSHSQSRSLVGDCTTLLPEPGHISHKVRGG